MVVQMNEIKVRLSTSVEDATSMPPLLLDLHQLLKVFNVLGFGHDMTPTFSCLSESTIPAITVLLSISLHAWVCVCVCLYVCVSVCLCIGM